MHGIVFGDCRCSSFSLRLFVLNEKESTFRKCYRHLDGKHGKKTNIEENEGKKMKNIGEEDKR